MEKKSSSQLKTLLYTQHLTIARFLIVMIFAIIYWNIFSSRINVIYF